MILSGQGRLHLMRRALVAGHQRASALSRLSQRPLPVQGAHGQRRDTASCSAHPPPAKAMFLLEHGTELDDSFTGLQRPDGMFTIAGFGSLLSERSARVTFPALQNFRPAQIKGWRRVFAHTADVFFKRGIARPETKEISSLSVEPFEGANTVVSLFEVPFSPEAVQAFIQREHEFKFVAVQPHTLEGESIPDVRAVICAKWNDDAYKARRCPPEEWAQRWSPYGIESVWQDDVLPCRVYLRHCVLAANSFCPEAYNNFLDATYLADRKTTVRSWLRQNPSIMEELPPPELVGRYSG